MTTTATRWWRWLRTRLGRGDRTWLDPKLPQTLTEWRNR